MTLVNLLSDTVYRQQAVRQLHQLLDGADEFPVEPTQIHGLRQIARQEPERVGDFANHQGQRAQSRYDAENERSNPRTDVLQKWETEVNFWTLVANFCGDSPGHWSVKKEGHSYLPQELSDDNLRKVEGATQQERQQIRQHNNTIKRERREWLEKWDSEHIPVFFERFYTHCLFCIAKAEMGQLASESANKVDELAQQDQSNSQDGGAMQTAFQQANLVE